MLSQANTRSPPAQTATAAANRFQARAERPRCRRAPAAMTTHEPTETSAERGTAPHSYGSIGWTTAATLPQTSQTPHHVLGTIFFRPAGRGIEPDALCGQRAQ